MSIELNQNNAHLSSTASSDVLQEIKPVNIYFSIFLCVNFNLFDKLFVSNQPDFIKIEFRILD